MCVFSSSCATDGRYPLDWARTQLAGRVPGSQQRSLLSVLTHAVREGGLAAV